MPDTIQAIAQLAQEDRRYPLDAYIFVFNSLEFAQVHNRFPTRWGP